MAFRKMVRVVLLACLLQVSLQTTIVIDSGSGLVKAGFAGDSEPQAVVPDVCGRPNDGSNSNEWLYFGQEALDTPGVIIDYPCQLGFAELEEPLAQVWDYTCKEVLNVGTPGDKVVITMSPKASDSSIAAMKSLVKTYLGSATVESVSTAEACLKNVGIQTALVVESGHSVTQATAFKDGVMIGQTVLTEIGGQDVSEALASLMGLRSGATQETDTIKEAICYVAEDFTNEMARRTNFNTPTGDRIVLTDEIFRAPEILFSYQGWGPAKEYDPIQNLIVKAISSAPADLKADLYSNIILSGGNTMFPGFVQRLAKEIEAIAADGQSFQLIAPPNRKFGAWVGATK
ncbi:actin-6-like isoform X2 [Symsagittifera roscoffensis]|uniref:actin-6-like isoform X2 n=1 Tax=Symsagittifera roscoffensis TaxID=84072 RepID=UPI00307C7D08